MTDLHKRAYVSGVRGVRTGLTRTGVMDRLDRWADESRTGLWVRSWFAVYDLDEMARLKVPWWTFDAADVVAVGPGAMDESGKLIPMEVAVGDSVLLPEYGATAVNIGEEEFHLLRASDILGKFEG